ncbi:MAG: DEAD/DEAH box helicase [Anaerolineae bacterium]|nr:DEAD/DEAH box helicase [Anaerolineae bacterium]
MHILHGTWLMDRSVFAIWGEDARFDVPPRKGKRRNFEPHPFGLHQSHRLNYILDVLPDAEPQGTEVSILLPGQETSVQPSPEAQSVGMPPLAGDLSLLQWQLDAITLDPYETLQFLLRLPPPNVQHPHFIVGADMAYWRQVALLMMNMLIEGSFRPGIDQQGARYEAFWRPSLTPETITSFARSMPPLCRAVVKQTASAPQPDALLDHFLTTTLNTLIRHSSKRTRPALAKSKWISALLSDDRVIQDTTARNEKRYKQWRAWTQPETLSTQAGAFRVCFRLDEPQDERNLWVLAYMLQARDDHSLLVDAINVWNATGRTASFLNRRFDQPQENMLLALGTASRLFTPIDASLRESKPVGVILRPEQAYEFLMEGVGKLEKAGFGVLVPNWWKRRKIKAKAKLKGEENASHGLLSRDSLISYEWQLSVGDEALTPQDFEELVQMKQPFLRLHGQWIALDADQIKTMLEFMQKHPAGKANLLQAMELGTDEDDKIEIEAPDAEGWLNEALEKLRNPEFAAVPSLPSGLNANLRPYQERGFGWLAQMQALKLGGILADSMGLGKTVQAITLWLHEQERLGTDRPRLLVAPTSVVGNWRHELAKFAPSLRSYVHQGAARLQGEDFAQAVADVDVVLTSYPLLSRDLDTIKQIQWSSITLDEAQNIKNPVTKMAQAARAVQADHRLALTGTPIENRLSELWSIMHFLNPGYLGSREKFRERFSLPIERYNDEAAAKKLKALTTPFILRRLKTDPKIISDLPDKFENKVYCTLTPEQATLYEAVVREEMEALAEAESDMQRRGGVLRMLTRLKQICNHPAHFLKEGDALGVKALEGRSGKLTRLTEMLDEVISNGDRALIFTQYAEMGKHLQAYLAEQFNTDVMFLFGDTPVEKRMEMVGRFQSPRGPSIFVLSLKAGGTGLNLTNANYVIHYDRWYNPAVEDQATDRAFRIGQTRNVQVNKMICLGTLEDRIDELIERKRGLADKIVGEGEGWLSELSNDDLRDLVTLRREALEGNDE